MNIDQLRDKVSAAEEKVEKCKKTIERHKAQMEKKAQQLRAMGIRTCQPSPVPQNREQLDRDRN